MDPQVDKIAAQTQLHICGNNSLSLATLNQRARRGRQGEPQKEIERDEMREREPEPA